MRAFKQGARWRARSYVFAFAAQDAIDVCIYEGERSCTEGNNMLGEFKVTGIQRAKRGEPKIDVTFDLDANGILTVTAYDQTTRSQNRIVIANNRYARGVLQACCCVRVLMLDVRVYTVAACQQATLSEWF